MGSQVEFRSNGDTASGYLAVPESGSGPGLLVIQEWWGLVPQIKETCDRLAGEGFVALAPDLYRGEIAEHTEMDKANELMQSLPPDRAARDMGGAIDYLLAHEAVRGDKVGVIGFCMGGMLALMITALQGDKVAVATPFYGEPLGDIAPDWSGLTASCGVTTRCSLAALRCPPPHSVPVRGGTWRENASKELGQGRGVHR